MTFIFLIVLLLMTFIIQRSTCGLLELFFYSF